jgi:hypothetical protein
LIEVPHAIAEYWYAVDWDVEALWALDLPARPFPIDRLLWHLDVPVWALDRQKYALTPRQVLRSPSAMRGNTSACAPPAWCFPSRSPA